MPYIPGVGLCSQNHPPLSLRDSLSHSGGLWNILELRNLSGEKFWFWGYVLLQLSGRKRDPGMNWSEATEGGWVWQV